MSRSRLFLIDAHAICYRSFYAIKSLTTSRGQATNAVYGFVGTLRKILRDFSPEYLAVCFDVGEKTKRQEKFKEYKIQRPKMPDDLISQIPVIKKVVAAYNLPVFEWAGFEADDVIATVATRMTKGEDIEVVIVTDDKDMFQLVNDRVKVYSARREKMFAAEDVKVEMGVSPQNIPDFISLAGDSVDNIPGVKGIGEVSALKLINQYGSLEKILANVDKVAPPKIREHLETQREMAVMSKDLAVLDSEVPLQFKLEDLKVGAPDHQQLFEMFSELEFKKFATEMAVDLKPTTKIDVVTICTAAELAKLKETISKQKKFAFQVESLSQPGEMIPQGNLFVATGGTEVFRIPLNEISGFKDILESSTILKVTYDIKEKLQILKEFDCGIAEPVFDCMLADYLLQPVRGDFNVGTLVWQYLKRTSVVAEPLADEAQALFEVVDLLQKELADKNLAKLLFEIEIPLAYVLFRMQEEGLSLDVRLLRQLSEQVDEKIQRILKDLFGMAGEEFNVNSPKQLSHILFDKLKLPVVKKTKTGFSTDEEVLTKLASKHALPAQILEYRQLAKLKSTYIDALPKLINERTGRIHGVFNQVGTETGRLSSNNPNMQNIPIRTELGKQIRKAFIPSREGNIIVSADYSQIELRILAHMSGDENLKKAFEKDQDIHQYTAALIMDIKESEVTAQMRNSAKRVNFGIIYGMSAFGLAKDLGISQGQAQDFIDRYFLRYPQVKKFMDDCIKSCEEKGYVTTLLQRRRYIPEIHNSNIGIRQFAQRQAINTPVQGSAADLIKLAMINVSKELERQKLKSQMILTVHDELVFDVLKKEESAMVELIRDKMENTMKLSVPIKVQIEAGKNWLDTQPVK